MEDSIQTKPSISQIWYERLDRGLLFLVTGELGYLILFALCFGILALLYYTSDLSDFLHRYSYGKYLFWPFLPIILALLLNTIGGFMSAVLHIATKHRGYPGTGHSINWLVCATNFWLIILAIFIFVMDATIIFD